MILKTPSFWYRNAEDKSSLMETMLGGLSKVYHAGLNTHRRFRTPEKANIPVICIGNLVAGGAGKTPVAMSMIELLQDHHIVKNPFFLTRGYGGSLSGPVQVTLQHVARQVGDEALQLASHAPTIVSKNRFDGAVYAAGTGADLALMDDGFQNLSLLKDLSFVVIDGERGFGNERLLPAGPLREPIEEGLQRADAIVIMGEDKRDSVRFVPKDKPVFYAQTHSSHKPDSEKNYIAFAGIATPGKFFARLQKQGLSVVAAHSFPDHYMYTRRDMVALAKEARDKNAYLITTDKDYKRAQSVKGDFEIETLSIFVEWQDEEKVIAFLKEKLLAMKTTADVILSDLEGEDSLTPENIFPELDEQ